MTRTIALFVAAVALGILSTSPRDASAHCDRPTLLVVLDRSSSMVAYSVPSGETRWQAVMAALGSVLDGFRDDIDFGLMVFPYPDGCTPGRVVIDPAPGNADAILDYIAVPPPPPPANSTPMAGTLSEAASYPPLADPSKRRAVVLVTDGNEWCYPYDPATRFDPVEAAADVRATGTEMYVIGMGGEGVDALVLNTIASESGTAIPGCDPAQEDALASNNCFHQAGDIPSLTAALETIARRVTSEICDGLDNDCSGVVDDNAICPGDEMCIRGACILVEQEEVPGCGCRTAGDAGGRSPALALLLLLVGLLARPLSTAARRG
jgi:MYXO-CTERM domain-containing protein